MSSVIIDSSIYPKAQHATGYIQAGGRRSISPLKVSDCYGYESNKTFMSASSEASKQKKEEHTVSETPQKRTVTMIKII